LRPGDRRDPDASPLNAVLEDVEAALVIHGELRRDAAQLLEREDLCEVLSREQGAMRIVGDPRRRGEAALDEPGICIWGLHAMG